MQDSWTKTGIHERNIHQFSFSKKFQMSWFTYLCHFQSPVQNNFDHWLTKLCCRKPTALRSKIINCTKFRTRQLKTRSTGLQLACSHWLFTRIKPRPPNENETVRNSSDFIEAQTCSRSCLLRVEITLRISFCRLIVRRQEDCSISLSCSLTISSPSWLDWKPVCFDYRVRSLSLSCASDTAQCKIWGSTLRNYFIKKLIFLCVI